MLREAKGREAMRGFWLVVLGWSMSTLAALSQQPAAPATTTATGDDAVQKLDAKAGMHAPKAIRQPEAAYPYEARQKGVNGKCLVSMIVDLQGRPEDVRIFRCSDPVFEQASMKSAQQYRFHPATTADGKPVQVKITVETSFRMMGARDIPDPISYQFSTPPGTTSAEPDAQGVYALTKALTVPRITKLVDEGYGRSAFAAEGRSPCEVVLTIDARGKPSDAVFVPSVRDRLCKAAAASLLASSYEPSELNGKAVAVRTLVHMEYGEAAGTK